LEGKSRNKNRTTGKQKINKKAIKGQRRRETSRKERSGII
jgi:hypothetical protein